MLESEGSNCDGLMSSSREAGIQNWRRIGVWCRLPQACRLLLYLISAVGRVASSPPVAAACAVAGELQLLELTSHASLRIFF